MGKVGSIWKLLGFLNISLRHSFNTLKAKSLLASAIVGIDQAIQKEGLFAILGSNRRSITSPPNKPLTSDPLLGNGASIKA
jgi:hypothetical protein